MFRGKSDVEERKDPGHFRIITMGGSCTRGSGVEPEQTYSHLLEEFLRQSNPPLIPEVLNAGVNGYNLIQIGDYLETFLLAYQPDLVIVYANAFDVSDQAIDPGKPIEAFDVRREEHSSSLKVIEGIQGLLYSLESYYLLTRLVLPLRDRAPDISRETRTLEGKASAGLLRIRLLCEMVKAELMIAEVVVRPGKENSDELYAPLWNRDRQWEGHFVPLCRPMIESGISPANLFFDEVHLTEQGHRIVASELTETILALGLIQGEHASRNQRR